MVKTLKEDIAHMSGGEEVKNLSVFDIDTY